MRPLVKADFELLLPFSLNEPELWKYSMVPADGADNLRNYIDSAIEGRERDDSYPFIIFDKRTDEVAGCTRFYDYKPLNETTQLGYSWYGKKFQGTGLNRNCKYLMLEFAFEILDLCRVEFRADSNNHRSIAAMKSMGCVMEGTLRSNGKIPGGRRDSVVLSILRDEWFGTVKAALSARLHETNLNVIN